MITADGAPVVSADHAASNGIIHVIDSVMLPVATQNIVSFLTSNGEFFSTLITAVKDAGLVDTLQGKNSTPVQMRHTTSAEIRMWGTITGHHAEVSRCCTRSDFQGMYIMYAYAMCK